MSDEQATGPKVALEVAEQEFARFASEMDLDVDESEMTREDLDSFLPRKRRIVRAIMKGHLVFNEDAEPVFTPQKGDRSPLTFYEWEGKDLSAMDKAKENETNEKQNAFLARWTKTHPERFEKMKGRDYKVCTALSSLFLAG